MLSRLFGGLFARKQPAPLPESRHEAAGRRLYLAVSEVSSIPDLQDAIAALEREFDIKFDAGLREHAIGDFKLRKTMERAHDAKWRVRKMASCALKIMARTGTGIRAPGQKTRPKIKQRFPFKEAR